MIIPITTIPFAKSSSVPLEMLCSAGLEIKQNLSHKLDRYEMADFIGEATVAIIGTEDLSIVLERCKNLKFLSKTGIGLDNIDLNELKKRGITLAYTPDAPTRAVAEMTISHMINLTRKLFLADRLMKNGKWQRIIGKEINECTIGIIGFGRVGRLVARLLSNFSPKNILINDILDLSKVDTFGATISTKEEIYARSDIITIHTPLTEATRGLISTGELSMMKAEATLINTARGAIISEEELYNHLVKNHLFSVGIDVFASEPYSGKLTELENAFLTCHMGSCSSRSRLDMECEASQNILDFLNNRTIKNIVYAKR